MKRIAVVLAAAAVMLVASPVWAGPYLNSAAMLVREALQCGEWMRANAGDRELARVAHSMAEARVNVASHMSVPKEVEKAHPHFLLILVNIERATDAASRGEVSAFLRHLDSARAETRTFRAVLDQFHLALPSLRDTPHASRPPDPSRRTDPPGAAAARAARPTATPAASIPVPTRPTKHAGRSSRAFH